MNRYTITDIDLYLCEIGDGAPQWQLSQQEEYVLNQRCKGTRWKAKDENDLINQIEDFIGHPVETMTYKTNNLIVKYPSYRNEEVST